MEHIPIPKIEQEPVEPDDIRMLIVKQEEEKMADTLERIKAEEKSAHRSKNIIESVELNISTGVIVVEVMFVEYEYDVYTYGTKEVGRETYSLKTDSVNEALETLAKHLVDKGNVHKHSCEPELVSIGLAVSPSQVHDLDAVDQEFRNKFNNALKNMDYIA